MTQTESDTSHRIPPWRTVMRLPSSRQKSTPDAAFLPAGHPGYAHFMLLVASEPTFAA